MEIKHIKTLLMVASTRSISNASQKLHLSQPSVTRIIQEIENAVGVPLFSRTKDGMILTKAGNTFYTQATRIISTLHAVILELKDPQIKDIVNIGFCPSILIFDLIEHLRYTDYDINSLRFHEMNAQQQFISLSSKHIDISFARGTMTEIPNSIRQFIVDKAELFAVIPASHRLSGKKMLSLDELKNDSFVGLSENYFPYYSENIINICKYSGFAPNFSFYANGYIAALATISAGAGVGIFPRGVVNSIIPGYVYIPIHSNKKSIDISCYIRSDETREEIFDLISRMQDQFKGS